MTWSLFIEILTPLSVLAVLYNNVVSGRRSATAEVLATYETQVKQLKEQGITQAAAFSKQISDLTLKVGEQNGIIVEREKQLKEYRALLENRNPELTTVLTEIRDFMKSMHDTITKINERVPQIVKS